MPRLEVELTSTRPDGRWTWRKAGARQPKGEVEATVLPAGAKVGDVLRVEAESSLDGYEITSVVAPRGERVDRFERIQIVGRATPEQLVTATLAPKRGGARGGRSGDRPRGDRSRDGGGRGDRRERSDGARGGQGSRPAPPPLPERPKPKRLRPRRTHRDAILAELAPEERSVAEETLRAGLAGVRAAIAKQNEQNKDAGLPAVNDGELMGLAERLLPRLRAADWRDRADAALSVIDDLDLRDLRSVVVAADSARDDEARGIAQQLREALTRRVEEEHTAWLGELAELISMDRIVRALRVSSRPPKAGVPLPADLAESLSKSASGSLNAEATGERWAAILDALALSPVRGAVVPVSVPENVDEQLRVALDSVADRLPHILEKFGIDPATVSASARKRAKSALAACRRPEGEKRAAAGGRPGGRPSGGQKRPAKDTARSPEAESPRPQEAGTDAPMVAGDVAAPETSVAEAPAPDSPEA